MQDKKLNKNIAAIRLNGISKCFNNSKIGNIDIFKNLSLDIYKGEFLTILGPNGCGKSTLFNIISGLDTNFDGHLDIYDEYLAYMFQKDLLLPWLSVFENCLIGVKMKSKAQLDEIINKANIYIEKVGLSNLKNSYPSKLSGGEKQKVALVRTLLLEPNILLLDEPFSAVDYYSRLELQEFISEESKNKGMTVIFISHNIDESIAISDRIAILNYKPLGLIKIIDVNLDTNIRDTLSIRLNPKYNTYFQDIWSNYPKKV